MGEKQGFVKFQFNDLSDVAAFEAGHAKMVEAAADGYSSAVLALKAAVLVGDLEGAGVAQEKIAQVSEQLISLGGAKSEADAFVKSQQPPVEG